MKKKIAFILFLLSSCLMYSQEKLASKIYLTNPIDVERSDESFVVKRNSLRAEKSNLAPVVFDEKGGHIPFQLDDMDGDGKWDELVFVYTLGKREKAILNIKWVAKEELPTFNARTNIRYGKMTIPGYIEELTSDFRTPKDSFPPDRYPYQMDGVAWENDLIAFRHYFDGRNNRDVYGKRVSAMVLDTVGIGNDGHPANSYQTLNEWGRDILNVGGSFGLGGLAIMSADTIIQLGDIRTGRKENIDSTYYRLITKGAVRSVFQLKYKGWAIGTNKINLLQTITIWAGKHNYENTVEAKNLPHGFNLFTGIVRSLNKEPLVEKQSEKFYLMMTHDRQTTDPLNYMGMALMIPKSNFVTAFDTPDVGSSIVGTWCAKLGLNTKNIATFDAYAAWELQDSRFSDRDYFLKYIESEAYKKDHPIKISVK